MIHEGMDHGRVVSMLPGVNHHVPPRMTHPGMVFMVMRNMVPGRMGLVKYVIARSNLNIRLLGGLLGRIGTLEAGRVLNERLMVCHGCFPPNLLRGNAL
ncbi:hypothetical protein DQX05_17745 [Paenibacillus thiaminolyticus]|uniref:Uncharacterized protein n=1 Tax=Paenibacillus thiaminolyticus TaxID=49283 RepID=A0A3A3GGZ7_PANTH|nr:hypothetical protein DQX05_17745 [Paenibacillus thiaminolyticus]